MAINAEMMYKIGYGIDRRKKDERNFFGELLKGVLSYAVPHIIQSHVAVTSLKAQGIDPNKTVDTSNLNAPGLPSMEDDAKKYDAQFLKGADMQKLGPLLGGKKFAKGEQLKINSKEALANRYEDQIYLNELINTQVQNIGNFDESLGVEAFRNSNQLANGTFINNNNVYAGENGRLLFDRVLPPITQDQLPLEIQKQITGPEGILTKTPGEISANIKNYVKDLNKAHEGKKVYKYNEVSGEINGIEVGIPIRELKVSGPVDNFISTGQLSINTMARESGASGLDGVNGENAQDFRAGLDEAATTLFKGATDKQLNSWMYNGKLRYEDSDGNILHKSPIDVMLWEQGIDEIIITDEMKEAWGRGEGVTVLADPDDPNDDFVIYSEAEAIDNNNKFKMKKALFTEVINRDGITDFYKNKMKRIMIDNAERINEVNYNQYKIDNPPSRKEMTEWQLKQLQLENQANQFAQSFKSGQPHFSEDGLHKWITSLEDGKVTQYTQMEKKDFKEGENPYEWVKVDSGTQEYMWNKRGYGSKVSPYNTAWDFKVNTDFSKESDASKKEKEIFQRNMKGFGEYLDNL